MASVKIIVVTPIEEQIVATFKRKIDALNCAALLQAQVNSSDINYFVEYKERGTTRRTRPNSLKSVITTLNNEQLGQLANLF